MIIIVFGCKVERGCLFDTILQTIRLYPEMEACHFEKCLAGGYFKLDTQAQIKQTSSLLIGGHYHRGRVFLGSTKSFRYRSR